MSYHGSRNIGEFEFMIDTIENEPELVSEIFSKMKFIAVRAEMLWGKGVVVYQGMSDMFGQIEHGQEIPYYQIQIKMSEDGLTGVSAVLSNKR